MSSFRRTPPGIEGYAAGEVDAFVREIEEALTRNPPTMRPEEVRSKVFQLRNVHGGYAERDVDAYLDEAERRLREAFGEAVAPPEPAPGFGWVHALGTLVILLGVLIVALVGVRAFV